MEHTCGEKVTDRAEPADTNSIIHPVLDHILESPPGSDSGRPPVPLCLSG